MNSRPLIVIAGCTASGKSSIALRLAKEINGMIINADSRQVYKEITIGSAKPKPDGVKDGIFIIDGIKHYLYSYVSVKENYNLYRYQKDVFALLKSLPKNTVPILVGGTGLYIDSVVYNYKLKEKGEEEKDMDWNSLSIAELQGLIGIEKLAKLNDSDKQNPRRLIHIIKHGLPSIQKGEPLSHLYFFLDIEQERIKENIRLRAENMIEEGLINENEMIRREGLDKYPALDTIGYKEFDGYFEKKKKLNDVKEEIITHTNQYAKRQRTWFKRNKEIIYVKDFQTTLKTTKTYLNSI